MVTPNKSLNCSELFLEKYPVLYYLMFLVIPFLFWKTKYKVSTHQGKLVGLSVFLLIFLILYIFNKVRLRLDHLDPVTLYSGSLYLVWLFASRFVAASPEGFWFNENGRQEGMIAILLYFCVFFVSRSAVNLKDSFWIHLCLVTTVSSLFRLSEFYNDYVDSPSQAIIGIPKELLIDEFKEFPIAFFGNRNLFGAYLCLMIPITFYLLFFRKKIWAIFPLGVQFWALVINQTRSALIGLAIGLPCLFILMFIYYGRDIGRKKIFLSLIVVVLLCTLVLIITKRISPQLWKRFTTIVTEAKKLFLSDADISRLGSGRVEVWMIVLNIIQAFPLFGTGLGAFTVVSPPFLPEDYHKRTGHGILGEAHNEYLQIAARTGIPSLLFWLLFLFSNLYQGLNRMKESPAYVVVFSSVVGYMVQAFFNISVPDNAWILFFFLGLLSRPGTLAPVDLSPKKAKVATTEEMPMQVEP